MIVDELAVGTIHTRTQNVRSALRAAVDDRLIARDPSAGVRLPRQRRSEVAMSLPTPEQVGTILRTAEGDFAPFIALCAFAGLRLGEASGVQVSDVDFLRRTLAVTRQVQRVEGGELDIRPPKYGSERTVFLAEDLVQLVARHVELHPPGAGGWLLGGLGDKPPAQTTVSAHWRDTLKRAGLSGFRLHDLRHF